MKIFWSFVCRRLGLCNEYENDLKVKVERFVEVIKRRGLKSNEDEINVKVLGGGEEVSIYEGLVDGT